MIITYTCNQHGDIRLYIGGKGSIESWIEPTTDGRWTFHMEDSVTANRLTDADRKAWAVYMLNELARELAVEPNDLASVPFATIANLHVENPFAGRRLPTGLRVNPDDCFKAAPPHIQAKFKSKARQAHRGDDSSRYTRS